MADRSGYPARLSGPRRATCSGGPRHHHAPPPTPDRRGAARSGSESSATAQPQYRRALTTTTAGIRGWRGAGIATCVAPTKPSELGVGCRSDASRDRAARDAANRRRRAWRGCYRDLRRSYKTAGAWGAAVAIATCVAPTKPSELGVGRRSDASRDRAARDAANRRRRARRGRYRDLRRSYGTRQRQGCGGGYRDLRRSYKTVGA